MMNIEIVDYFLGAFAALSAANTLESLVELATQFTSSNRNFRSSSNGLLSVSVLSILQLVASLFNTVNMGLFIIQHSVQGLDCTMLANAMTVVYFPFQILSTTVLITRATVVIKAGSTQSFARLGLLLMLGLAVGLIMVSSVMRTVTVTQSGTCLRVLNVAWNNVAKIILMLVYTGALSCFIVPIFEVGHINRIGHFDMMKTTSRRLKWIAFWMSIKISTSILAYLVTAIVAFTGMLNHDSLSLVLFAIQNYACILSSSWSCRMQAEETSLEREAAEQSADGCTCKVIGRSSEQHADGGSAQPSILVHVKPGEKLHIQTLTHTATTNKEGWNGGLHFE
eukprot:jgi/Hompol1/439/HPOL_002498-RA